MFQTGTHQTFSLKGQRINILLANNLSFEYSWHDLQIVISFLVLPLSFFCMSVITMKSNILALKYTYAHT